MKKFYYDNDLKNITEIGLDEAGRGSLLGPVFTAGVILNDTEVFPNAYIENAIIDKRCKIMENVVIGDGDDLTPNKEKPDILSSGINAIASRVTVPAGTIVKRNCRIFSTAKFDKKVIESGSTLR